MNDLPEHGQPLDPRDAEMLGPAGAATVQRYLDARPDYAPTPLVSLPALAAEMRVGAVWVKDESQRLGLSSFKALGGAYAVIRLVLEKASETLGREVSFAELESPEVRAVAAGMTFACATDGNHGRSVAAGAKLAGARAVIFVHEGVSYSRAESIAAFGAEIVRVAGHYDESVAEANVVSACNHWQVVSDTSWEGYERIPSLVMQGYTAMLSEAMPLFPAPPTHVFMQAGVGGLAAAVAAHFALVYGEERPTFVVVEPARAACLLSSMKARERVKIPASEPTMMAMLECYEPSLVAWRILSRTADAFMSLYESEALKVMQRLARPQGADPRIVSGESGGAGLAGAMRACSDESLREVLKLDSRSRLFFINSEGATDQALYEELVGFVPA